MAPLAHRCRGGGLCGLRRRIGTQYGTQYGTRYGTRYGTSCGAGYGPGVGVRLDAGIAIA
ncbi:hypothetical protein [Cupriavidus cauae]|uniref:hypothetical protein n=1 Tax=Cupriavidus cauae TaxID=2608999 RepID=UPI001CC1DF53|nr:hypothetical protein [Cupriavidus cauae]